MTEETQDQEDQQEAPQPNIIDNALDVVERMEDANEKAEELLRRQEEIVAKQILSGKAEAGGEKKEEKKEIDDKEYAMKALKGELGNEGTD